MVFQSLLAILSVLVFLLLALYCFHLVIAKISAQRSENRTRGLHTLQTGLGTQFSADEGNGMADRVCELMNCRAEDLRQFAATFETEQVESFYWGLFVSLLGFGLVAAGVVLSYVFRSEDLTTYTTVGGCVVQVISGLFFWIYAKSTNESNMLYRNMIDAQNTLAAIAVADRLEAASRDDAYAAIIRHLLSSGASAGKTGKTGSSKAAPSGGASEPPAPGTSGEDASGTAPASTTAS